MRERFRTQGLEGFAPHEVLELLLFYGRARGDVNPLAHALMDHFGSLKGVLEAEPAQLMTMDGIGEETATLISLMLPMFRRYAACLCEERKVIGSIGECKSYCEALLAGQRTEHFYVLSLSAEHQLLGQRLIAKGSLSEVAAYPRLVVEAALHHNAQGVILCHNHPNGSCKPSQDDVATTQRLHSLLAGMDIALLDHVIVAEGSSYSMAEMGVLEQMRLMMPHAVQKQAKGKNQ